jgi:DNA-binding transcriptional regulator YiaG
VANLTSALKDEITRLARKEIKAETEALKKATSQYRSEIADLKRRATVLEKQQSKLGKVVSRNEVPKPEVDPSKIRFIAKGFKSMRERLGLTAKQISVLLDISPPTIYNWEAGISKPKKPQLIRIAHLRTMSKNDVADVLAQFAASASKAQPVKKQQASKATPKASAKTVTKTETKATVKAVKPPVKSAPKAAVKATANAKAKPVTKVVAQQPAKPVTKAVAKPASKAAPKTKAPKVVSQPAAPEIKVTLKVARKPHIAKPKPAPTTELAVKPGSEPVNVTAPAPIPVTVAEPVSVSQTEV